MPLYSIHNTDTDEVYEVNLKSDEREEFLAQNPHLKQVFIRFPGICDPVRIGVRKTDAEFRDVLSKAKGAHKHSTIEY